MENQGMQEEQANVFVKKEWIEPEINELIINGGISGGAYEVYGGTISL